MKTRSLLFIGLFVLISNLVIGQSQFTEDTTDCDCYSKPIPIIFVNSTNLKIRDKQCKQRRWLVKKNKNPMFPADKFINLLKFITNTSSNLATVDNGTTVTVTNTLIFDGLRVYLAATSETKRFDDKFRLIFVPTTTDANGTHYTNSKFYFIWENNNFKTIPIDITSNYIKNYQKSLKEKKLDKMRYHCFLGIGGHTLIANSTNAIINKEDKGDTRSMLYKYKGELLELQNELDSCQKNIVKMVRIDISSYGHKQLKGEEFDTTFMDRLILHFKMFQQKGNYQNKYKPYSLEDNKKCYQARLQNKDHLLITKYNPEFEKDHKLVRGEAGFDTGVPCPPSSCVEIEQKQ